MQTELKLLKNPNWWKAADQLAIYRLGSGIGTWDGRVVNAASAQSGNEVGISDSKSGGADYSATLPPLVGLKKIRDGVFLMNSFSNTSWCDFS